MKNVYFSNRLKEHVVTHKTSDVSAKGEMIIEIDTMQKEMYINAQKRRCFENTKYISNKIFCIVYNLSSIYNTWGIMRINICCFQHI